MSTSQTTQSSCTIRCFDVHEAVETLHNLLNATARPGRIVGVITPTQPEAKALRELLETSVINSQFVGESHGWPRIRGSVVLAALENTKGTEFDEVIVFMKDKQSVSLSPSDKSQRLQAVAAARAKAAVTVICH